VCQNKSAKLCKAAAKTQGALDLNPVNQRLLPEKMKKVNEDYEGG